MTIRTKSCQATRIDARSEGTTAAGAGVSASVTGERRCDELDGVEGARSERAQQVSACACVVISWLPDLLCVCIGH